MAEFDINEMFKTLGERLAAAKSALRATTFGRGGAISIVQDGDRVKFKIGVLDQTFETIQEAVKQAAALGVTESVSFKNGKAVIAPGSKINAQAAIYESVYSKLQNLTPDQKQILERAGIDTKQLKTLGVDFATMRAKGSGGVKAVAEQISKFREAGALNGITIMDDEGARVIQFRSGQGLLNAYQSNLLLTMSGHSTLNADTFGKILRSADDSKLADKFGKLGKRLRGFLAERDVPLAGAELTEFLKPSRGRSLASATLALDPQYELLRLFAADDDITKARGISNAARAFYDGKSSRDYFGRILDQAVNDPGLGDDAVQNLKAAINGFGKKMHDAKSSPWVSDSLKQYLLDGFADGSEERKALVNNIFDSIEFAFDGSDLLNAKNLNKYKATLRKEKTSLDEIINDTARPAAQREEAMLKKIRLQGLLDNLSDTDALQQITGRGNIPGLGTIKTAFQVSLFDKPELENFAAIISKFGFKSETSISGNTAQLILSGLGQGSESVYVDPVASAFNPALFADSASLDAMERHGKMVLAEFEEAVDSAVLPDRILNQLKMASATNVDEVPSAMRSSAIRNREYAQALLRYHRSGVSVKNSPQMMNMLHSFFATQAFREKDGFIQAVMPDVYRFAIDSEAILGSKQGENNLLGEGFERMGRINVAGEVINIDQDILKFRVQGHKMMFSAQAIGEYRHALGGFDLDDKGLPKLRTYVDNDGMNRLGFYIFRQPSGPEETIFARANFDAETIQALFDKKHFRTTLDTLINEGSSINGLDLFELRDIISGNLKSGYNEDEIEQAVFRVFERMEKDKTFSFGRLTRKEAQRLQEFGSSPLKVTPDMLRPGLGLQDFSPQYNNDKVFKVLTDSNAFNMRQDIVSVLDSVLIDKGMKAALESAGSFQEMMQILGAGFEGNAEAQSLLATAFQQMAEKRALQAQGSLGVYVNRSMVTGSVLNQYEEMFNSIQSTSVRKFLAQNYNIGLVAQEEAIDLSINFSGTRTLNFELMRRVAEASSVNEAGLAGAIADLTRVGGGDVTLDMLGEGAISNLGKLIGFSSGLNVADDLKVGIDKFLLQNRLNDGDAERLARGMLRGLNDVRRFAKDRTAVDDRITELTKVLETRVDEDIRNYLMNSIGLDATSRFASLSKQQEVGKLLEMYFDNTKSMKLASMAKDEILASTKVSAEATAVAQKILDDNKKAFDAIMDTRRTGLSEMSELDKVNFSLLLNDTGTKVYSQIDQAKNVANVNMLELVAAFDNLTANTYRDISSLGALMGEDVPPEMERVFRQIIDARRAREVLFYNQFDQSMANEAIIRLQAMAPPGQVLDKEGIRRQAAAAIESMTDDQLETMEGGIYRVLADSKSSIADEFMAEEAQRQVNIMDAVIDARDMQDTMQALEARGITSVADIADDTDEALVRLIQATEDPEYSVASSSYKRVGEKVGDFKNLFRDNKIFRRGLLGAAALVAGSFVYSAVRDRTSDDVTGPPLLPGGNPYEQDYPTAAPNIGNFGPMPAESGVSYRVSINGSRGDVEKFNERASGLFGGRTSTTMYNRLPDMRRDPYSSMGQMY